MATDLPQGGSTRSGFDAHTHLSFDAFAEDLQEVCARARAAGVSGWAVVGVEPQAWLHAQEVAAQTGGLLVAGVHPWWAGQVHEQAALSHLPQVHAIGEIGLDRLRGDWERQESLLRAQLALARERELPVVLHCVKAWPELLSILRRDELPRSGGMVHGWAGPTQLLQAYLDLGLHISLGPRVLRATARKEREAAKRVPAHRLLLETDCPESPLAGQTRGEPADLVQVAMAVAEMRGQDWQELLTQCGDSARRLFMS